MKTISVRDLRQRWPEAEKLLAIEGELIVTRDSKPVAKLVRYLEKQTRRRRLDPEEYRKRQREVHGPKTVQWVDKYLQADRDVR